VRELTRRYKKGDNRAAEAFRELVSLLFDLTVAGDGAPLVLARGPVGGRRAVLQAGYEPTGSALPLNDGRFLRVHVTLSLEDTPEGRRLKVIKSSYQYQVDREGERWIVRYDYLREPGPDPHPQAHVQVRGALIEAGVPARRGLLEHVHLPTGRVSVEAVIRLLAEQFGVRCNEPATVWRPVLAESERLFQEIAHRPLSGPAT